MGTLRFSVLALAGLALFGCLGYNISNNSTSETKYWVYDCQQNKTYITPAKPVLLISSADPAAYAASSNSCALWNNTFPLTIGVEVK